MRKMFAVLVVSALGVALGRLAPPRAEAGGGNPLPPCQDINGDGRSNVSDAVFFLQWLFIGGPAPVCPSQKGQSSGLPETGQTRCYDIEGAEIPCDSATCPGQDGLYATGCASEGRFVDNGDGTVTDTCTGLMWQKDTAAVLSWCDALAYCENLSFAGHDDWRLPNVRELQSIVDYGRVRPAIDPVFHALASFYWSSTSHEGSPDHAWGVLFSDGFVKVGFGSGIVGSGDGSKDHQDYVRAVRRGP